METIEIYKTIDGYDNYEVSNLGNVRNKKTGKVLRPSKVKKGYLQVGLYKKGKQKKFKVHRLIASVFLENPDNKSDVNHINGIKTDNCVENLEWNTHSENVNHSFRSGLNKHITKCRCIETGQEFESQLSAGKYFGCDQGAIRNSIYKGHRCKGFHFELI